MLVLVDVSTGAALDFTVDSPSINGEELEVKLFFRFIVCLFISFVCLFVCFFTVHSPSINGEKLEVKLKKGLCSFAIVGVFLVLFLCSHWR